MRLVVLDVDDTLYLERDYVRSGFAAVGAHIAATTGLTGLGEKAWQLFEAGTRGNIFDLVLADARDDVASLTVADLVRVYREHRPSIELTADSQRFIAAVAEHGPIAVITDGPAASQRAKLAALGADTFAAEIIVTSERGPDWTKPSPLAFEYLQKRFGATPQACTYYGDNPHKDFIAPKALGWHGVRIRRPGGLHFAVADDGGAETTVADFDLLDPMNTVAAS